jgi:hypothetical protein
VRWYYRSYWRTVDFSAHCLKETGRCKVQGALILQLSMSVARADLSRDYLTGKSAIMLDKSVLGGPPEMGFSNIISNYLYAIRRFHLSHGFSRTVSSVDGLFYAAKGNRCRTQCSDSSTDNCTVSTLGYLVRLPDVSPTLPRRLGCMSPISLSFSLCSVAFASVAGFFDLFFASVSPSSSSFTLRRSRSCSSFTFFPLIFSFRFSLRPPPPPAVSSTLIRRPGFFLSLYLPSFSSLHSPGSKME